MTRQRVGDVDVVPVVFTPVELMSLLAAATREARRLRREYGAPPATLSVIVERLQRLAADIASDALPRSASAHRGHAATSLAAAPAGSAVPDRHGPVQRYSVNEAADLLGLSRRHVRRLAALDGELTSRGTYAIDPATVAAWALRRTTGEAPDDGVDPARTPPRDSRPDPGRGPEAAEAG